jgi:hypothetical protein
MSFPSVSMPKLSKTEYLNLLISISRDLTTLFRYDRYP